MRGNPHYLSAFFLATAVAATALADPRPIRLERTSIALRQVDLSSCLTNDHYGYPKIDAPKLDLSKIVEREHAAVVLENSFIRAIVLPEMGRIWSLVSKTTGHEQLWTNAIARPLLNQHNDTGWWMVWGGVEHTIPSGEHGTTWALPWKYHMDDRPGQKAVHMEVVEPKTGLRQTVTVALSPQEAALRTTISVRNPTSRPVRFSHWVNPMWAPGGRGEITPQTEFIVPTKRMVVADKPFNGWMLGNKVQEYSHNPLRFAANWQTIGDLLAEKLETGFYSAFCHEANEGVARIFDHRINPGMDIWTWGYPPPPKRQSEYSLTPNKGYVEMWGGTATNFSDKALSTLAPRKEIKWTEWMYPYHETGGLTFANEHCAVNFRADERLGKGFLGLMAVRPLSGALKITSRGKTLLAKEIRLSPAERLQEIFDVEIGGEAPQLVIRSHGRQALSTAAVPPTELKWGGEWLPRPNE